MKFTARTYLGFLNGGLKLRYGNLSMRVSRFCMVTTEKKIFRRLNDILIVDGFEGAFGDTLPPSRNSHESDNDYESLFD
jgi:hypothetical protein